MPDKSPGFITVQMKNAYSESTKQPRMPYDLMFPRGNFGLMVLNFSFQSRRPHPQEKNSLGKRALHVLINSSLSQASSVVISSLTGRL